MPLKYPPTGILCSQRTSTAPCRKGTKIRTGVYWQAMKTHKLFAAVAGLLYVSPGHAQSGKGPFQIMETTIDDVHAAYKSGKLTAHQLVQGYLDRINAYDKQGPRINSIITLNPKALEEADKLDTQYKNSGLSGSAARHSGFGQRRDRHCGDADDVGLGVIQGLPAAFRRIRGGSIEKGGSDHPRQDDAE